MTVKKVFLAGLMLLPFIFWPWAKVPFEIPKVWFFCRWMEVLGVLGCLGILGRRLGDRGEKGNVGDRGNWGNLLVLLVVFYLVVAVVASVLGVDPVKSLIGNYYRGDGLYALFHLVGLFFFVNLFWEKSWERSFIRAVGIGAVGVSVLGGLARLFPIVSGFGEARGIGLWIDGSVGATFGNPNFLGGYLLVCLPVVKRLVRISPVNFVSKIDWAKGLVGLGGVAIVITGIVMTGARSALLGVGIWAILELVLGWGGRRGGKGKLGRLVWLGVVGVVGAIGVIGCLGNLGYLGKRGDEYNFESRERIVRKAGIAFNQRPLLGWGVANFDYAFQANDWPIKYNDDVYVDKAHSTVIENFVTVGVLGGLGYLGIIGLTLVQLIKLVKFDKFDDLSRMCLIVFLLYLYHSQTNVISINEEMVFWIVAGIAASGKLLDKG